MYFTYNEGNSVVVEKSIRTLKEKSPKKMTANENKSHFGYLNNTYRRSIDKTPIDVDYFALTEKTESSHKDPKFKSGTRVKITKYNNNFNKV